MIDTLLPFLGKYMPEINSALGAGLVIFARTLGFIRLSPVFNRSEVTGLVKLSLALILTIILTSILKPAMPETGVSLTFSLILNFAAGAIIGFVANCVILAIEAAGDMINMQMGLSSAMVLDPTTSAQVSIVGKFFALIAIIIFIHVGGVYWLIRGLIKSFEIFPVYATSFPLDLLINQKFLIQVTSNILYVGLQIASPVLLATLGQDLILGIISKTAPQINVFQLSFLFKPVLGAAILIFILPMIFEVIAEYFNSYSSLFM